MASKRRCGVLFEPPQLGDGYPHFPGVQLNAQDPLLGTPLRPGPHEDGARPPPTGGLVVQLVRWHEKKAIKEGRIPPNWKAKPAKLRH